MSEEFSEAAEPSTEPPQETAIETEAREMGWRPKEEFSGNGEWRDADEFVERGNNINGILRKRLEVSEARTAELTTTVGEFTDHMKKVDKRAYDKAVKDLQTAQREAVDEADTEKFDRATKDMNDLEPPITPTAPQVDPAWTAWNAENAWYTEDVEMSAYADNVASAVQRKLGGVEGKPHLDAVAAEVKRKFPDRFENPRRAGAPSVESGSPAPKSKSDPHGYANIDAEGKAAFNRFVKEGIFESTDADRAAYAADYFEGDA